MATRPKRACTELARERIARIIEWENCSEGSALFRHAAAKMEREFRVGVAEPDAVQDKESSDEDIITVDDPAETDEKNKISTNSEEIV